MKEKYSFFSLLYFLLPLLLIAIFSQISFFSLSCASNQIISKTDTKNTKKGKSTTDEYLLSSKKNKARSLDPSFYEGIWTGADLSKKRGTIIFYKNNYAYFGIATKKGFGGKKAQAEGSIQYSIKKKRGRIYIVFFILDNKKKEKKRIVFLTKLRGSKEMKIASFFTEKWPRSFASSKNKFILTLQKQ